MKTKTKKIISSILIAANIAIPANITLAKSESKTHQEVKVYFNEEKIEFDQQPIIVDGRTKVPFRAIFETMGTVVYHRVKDNSILAITRDGDAIYHVIGTNKATKNGKEFTFDSTSELKNDRTLIPVRMVADLLNAKVEWDGNTSEVDITKEMDTNEYHKKIRGILGCSIDKNFNPEDFKRYVSYQYKHWNMDPKQVILDVNMDLDRELVEGTFTVQLTDYYGKPYDESITGLVPKKEDITLVEDVNSKTVLVNKFNILPYDYTPNNIKLIEKGKYINSDFSIKSEAYNDFMEFSNAYKNFEKNRSKYYGNNGQNGLIYNNSGMLSNGFTKKHTLDNEVFVLKRVAGDKLSGVTEQERLNYIFAHTFDDLQTGLSFDFGVNYTNVMVLYKKRLGYTLSEQDEYFANMYEIVSESEQWRRDNAHKYGFVLRYPRGKEHITRMRATDEIYRYVGKEVAKIMYDENLCLEEYCAKYESKTSYKTDIESTKKKVLQRY